MSNKAKSKPGSASSLPDGRPDREPAANAEAEPKSEARLEAKGDGKPRSGRDPKAQPETVSVYLVSDRGRRAVWTLGGLVLGGLLFWKLGTVASALGVLLMAAGVYHSWFLVRTLRFDPGALVLYGDQTVQLPLGLCRGQERREPARHVRAAYFLRHKVPMSHTAPVLVVEVAGPNSPAQALTYPRDWFASEADQRRFLQAILPLIGAPTGAASPEP